MSSTSVPSPSLRFLFVAAGLLLPASSLAGRGSGVLEGESGIPKKVTSAFPACGFCHGSGFPNERGKVTVKISSPRSLTLNGTMKATISLLGGVTNSTRGGFSLDSSGGILTRGTNTRVGNSGLSITHVNSLSRSWTFSFKGTKAGLVTWTCVGNTVDGNGRNTGDSWGWYGPNSGLPGVPYRIFVDAAGVTPFGRACAGTGGFRPLAGIATTPTIGKSFQLEIHEVPPATAVLGFLGFSDKRWAGLPLPLPLTGLGARGCILLTGLDIVQIGVSKGAGPGNGVARFTWAIPNNPSLRNLALFFQALVVDKTANKLGMTASNAVKTVLR